MVGFYVTILCRVRGILAIPQSISSLPVTGGSLNGITLVFEIGVFDLDTIVVSMRFVVDT